jgi:hypothetical protein
MLLLQPKAHQPPPVLLLLPQPKAHQPPPVLLLLLQQGWLAAAAVAAVSKGASTGGAADR